MNKKIKRILLSLATAALLALVVFYSVGYRITRSGIERNPKIRILGLASGTRIFLDNRDRGILSGGGNFSARVSAGRHSIMVVKDGYWPYLKEIGVEMDKEYAITPFEVSRNPGGVIITKKDKEYDFRMEMFGAKVLPNAEKPLVSKDGNSSVWVWDGIILAKWLGSPESRPYYYCVFETCPENLKSFDPITEIRGLSFYKDRNDVLIVAAQNGIFALELDPFGTQNFQPIYEGKDPEFRIGEDKNMYVLDGGVLMMIGTI